MYPYNNIQRLFPNNLAVHSSRPNDVPVSLGVAFDQPLVPVLFISYGIVHPWGLSRLRGYLYVMPQALSNIIIVIIIIHSIGLLLLLVIKAYRLSVHM